MSAMLRCITTFLLFSLLMWSQASTGTITGAVRDSSGAAIVAAQVVMTHQGTSVRRDAVTNERGEFTAPYLPIGEYTVSVSLPGFKTATTPGVILQVDKTVTLNFALEPGAITESIEVTASAPLIDAATSSLGQVIDNKKIINLPLNGRNAFALGLLSGNTVPVAGVGSNLPFVAGGGRFQNNDVLLDGVDNNSRATDGNVGRNGIAYTPSVDAITEFKVKTNNYSAEFGRSGGAIISATIKSGTNEFHGSMWEFLRNEKLDANNFFSNASNVKRQPFKQSQFGFTLGGPVWIPKLYNGRQKTFFFVDYEGLRRATSASSSVSSIPPMAYRTGDFSGYKYNIYDPSARRIGPNGTVISTPFAGNKIPTSQLNKASVAVMGLLPAPNAGAAGADSNNFLFIAPRPYNTNQYDVRLDHSFTEKNTMFSRISRSTAGSTNPGRYPGFAGGGSNNINNAVNGVFSDTAVLTPTLVNDARFGYTRHNTSILGFGPQGADFARQNGVALYPFPVQSFPDITFAYSGLTSGGTQFSDIGGGDPTLLIENTFEGAENLTWMRGSHSFKVGADVRRYRVDSIYGGGNSIFGSIFSASSNDAGSGAPLADFLLGYPATLTGKQLLDWARQRDLYFGTYIQDDWKITSKLTLNIGIRYELFTQPVDARDRGALFDARTGIFQVPGQNGFSRALVSGHPNNWAPRVGFAWNPTTRWTYRGGAGVFYAQREQNQQNTMFGSNPPNTPVVISPAVSAGGTLVPPVNISSPIQVGPLDPTLKAFSAASPLGLLVRTTDLTNSRPPVVYQANFGVQYQLLRDMVVEGSYSALHGSHLVSRVNLNQIPWAWAMAGHTTQADRMFPQVGDMVVMDSSSGNNFYNSLNLRAEKRFSAGFDFLANFTWSKNLESNGTGGSSSFSQSGGTTNPLDSWNLQKEKSYGSLDIPKVFVASGGYQLPFGKGRHWGARNPVVSALARGWQLNAITTMQNGFPTDIRTKRIASANQMFATFNMPDRISGVSMYLPDPGPNGYFNAAAFADPGSVNNVKGTPITLFGNSARRVGRGPNTKNLDFSIFRSFDFKERFHIQFRAEAFNITNTPAFMLPAATSPALTLGNAGFGKLTDSSATGRQLQFGLKLLF